MVTTITCPKCHTQFEPTDALRDEVQKELRQQMQEWQEKKNDEFNKKELQFQQQKELLLRQQQEQEAALLKKMDAEKQQLVNTIIKEQQEKAAGEFSVKLKHLENANIENEARLKAAREKELDYLKRIQEVDTKEQEMAITLQKQLIEERSRLQEALRKEEDEKSRLKDQEHQFKMKELELQLDQQRKLAEEMRRKAEQGSMQLQGEVQELMLESMLRNAFPFDLVEEVGKGVRGADCILTVRNKFGQECGRIIYESKRTKDFSADWIDKLKADMRSLGADIAVIVTQTMPRNMESFGEKDGVWICTFREALPMSGILREQIFKVFNALKNNENKADKMALLYQYLTSGEFSEQWKAIREGFLHIKNSIQRERDAMEKLWKMREKQLEKILLNAAHIKGSIEGISGADNIDLGLMEPDDTLLLE